MTEAAWAGGGSGIGGIVGGGGGAGRGPAGRSRRAAWCSEMCGIVGYAGRRRAMGILLDSLKRLEYRGYDSAGIAIVGDGLQVYKDKGFIANLEAQLPSLEGTTGLAHTRWATHGPPSKVNAHPHVDCAGRIALAHNGID